MDAPAVTRVAVHRPLNQEIVLLDHGNVRDYRLYELSVGIINILFHGLDEVYEFVDWITELADEHDPSPDPDDGDDDA